MTRRASTMFLSVLLCAFAFGTIHAKDEYLYLNSFFDTDGFLSNAKAKDAHFGRKGIGFLAGVLSSRRATSIKSTRFGSVRFLIPDTSGTKKNMVACKGQRIPVRTKKVFNTLFILGSGHNGDPSGWLEFEYADGTKSKAPFGLSDWFDVPVHGEEVAAVFQKTQASQNPVGGESRLWLQHSPIPRKKKLVAITLPELPNAKIVGLSLGNRSGVRPVTPPKSSPLEDADVAVFAEAGFPYSEEIRILSPESIRDSLKAAGLRVTLVDIDQLIDEGVFSAERFPVLVSPYGSAFPFEALDALRRYRVARGVMVHLGAPFRRRCSRSPYGTWRHHRRRAHDKGLASEYADPSNAEYLGTAPFLTTKNGKLAPSQLLRSLGMDAAAFSGLRSGLELVAGLRSRTFVLDPPSELFSITPLLTYGGDPTRPFAAVFRYTSEKLAGAMDICLGTGPLWRDRRPVSEGLVLEMIVRTSAWALAQRERLDEETLERIVTRKLAAIPAPPVPVSPPEDLGNPFPMATHTPTEILVVDAAVLSSSERILLASAQGLLNRAGARAVYTLDRATKSGTIKKLKERDGVESVEAAELKEVLGAVGHRRAILVDPELPGSLNVATMIAALEGMLVAYPIDVKKRKLEVVVDLRGMFESSLAMLEFVYENLWPRFSKSCLAVYPPVVEAWELRDYLIAQKVFMFWVPDWRDRNAGDVLPSKEREIIDRMLAESPVATPVIGTFGEGVKIGIGRVAGARYVSRFGKYFVPLEVNTRRPLPGTLRNVSFLARASEAKRSGSTADALVASREPERGKVYLAVVDTMWNALVLTDAPQRAGAASGLGKVAIGGALEPAALFDLVPSRARQALTSTIENGVIGAGELGIIDRRVFGGAFGRRRKEVLSAYYSATSGLLERHRIAFANLRSSGDLASELRSAEVDALLPATTVVVANPERGQNVLSSVKSCGKATLLRTFSQVELTAFLADTKSAKALLQHCPMFLVTSPSVVAGLVRTSPLPDFVEMVAPDELGALAASWRKSYEMETTELLPAGATWRYHDKGEDLGDSWSKPDYDDASWPNGNGEFGYGDKKEKTTLSFGDDKDKKHPSYYFRCVVGTKGLAKLDVLIAEFVADDGCVVYLDGEEAIRYGMPAGAISHTTMASSTISGSAEKRWNQHIISSKPRSDKLVIAVELHQATASSSDLGFDLKLKGIRWKKRSP